MPDEADRAMQVVADAARAVADAPSIAVAVVAAARSAIARYSVWHAHAMVFTTDELAAVVAEWSASGATLLEPGTEIAIDLTPTTRTLVDEVLRGAPLVFSITDVDLGLAGAALRDEGFGAVGVAPLRVDGVVVGAYNLVSSDEDAFQASDRPFLAALGEHIEEDMVDLMKRSGVIARERYRA